MSTGLSYRQLLGRIVAVSFVVGAGVELFMIYARIGNETFYDTAKRKEMQRRPERRRKNEEFRGMMRAQQAQDKDG